MNYKYFVLLVLWMTFIFYLSGIPSLGIGLEGHANQVSRKSIHVILYGILTLLMWFSIPKFDVSLTKKILLCAFLTIFYAIIDEIHQSFVPGRSGNAKGALFDLIGIIAVLIWLGLRQRRILKHKLTSLNT